MNDYLNGYAHGVAGHGPNDGFRRFRGLAGIAGLSDGMDAGGIPRPKLFAKGLSALRATCFEQSRGMPLAHLWRNPIPPEEREFWRREWSAGNDKRSFRV